MSTSSGYQPRPTTPVPTGVHQVIPNRGPSVVGVRQSFEATFGAYVPPDWTLDAECTRPGTDPELFYPRKGGSQLDRKALSICAACPVREECLDAALEFEVGDIGADDVRPEVFGVRGGMVSKERRRLVQKIRVERKAAHEAEAREKVAGDYKAGKLTVKEIALRHGISQSTVTRWAVEAGIEPRPRHGGRKSEGSSA